MHLFCCQNPVKINQYGVERFVPCGKCDYCRFVRSVSRSQRSTDELHSHKYAVFVTLTYHDLFLPLASYDRDMNLFYFGDTFDGDSFKSYYSECCDGLCWNVNQVSDRDLKLIDLITARYGGIPVLRRYDFQCFMKRLRINIKRKFYKDQKFNEKFKITYTACGEYGPTTYRPHFHILLMFDEYQYVRELPRLVRESWKVGIATVRYVDTKSEDGHYTAEYNSGISRLPKFYQARQVAPFFLSSKASPIGRSAYGEEEIKRSYDNCSPLILRKDSISVCDLSPLPPFIENKLYPRFTLFNCITRRMVLDLLRECLAPYRNEESGEVVERTRKNYLTLFLYNTLTCQNSSDLNMYYQFVKVGQRFFENSTQKFLCSAAYSIYYAANRYKKLMVKYGLTLEECVDRTYLFLHNKDMLRLQIQFEFENEWYDKHPDWLLYIESPCVSDRIMQSTEFGQILNHVRGNIDHSHKNRRKREYLSNHPEYSYIDTYDDERDSFAPAIFNY